MKRDNEREMDQKLDRQMDSLAQQLRDKGIPPERDLWQGIDQAIDRTEAVTGGVRTRINPLTGWRIVALAASILLLVGVGLVQMGGLPGSSNEYRAENGTAVPSANVELAGVTTAESGDGEASSMEIIDRALDDLNRALADDPNNPSLSHLILVIHKSRGNLIRNTARRLAAPGF
jgi:hypothetical protein